MAAIDRYGAPKRTKKRRSVFAPLAIVLIVAAILFGMGVFFRVQTIEVVGAEIYTEAEIIESSGIEIGDNLFFIPRFDASSNIFASLPFVEEASIARVMPNKVVITVSESTAVAYLDYGAEHWIMTANGKLLGAGNGEELDGLIHILNLSLRTESTDGERYLPKSGIMIQVNDSDSSKLGYAKELLSSASALGMTADISELNLDNAANPTFRYLDRFTVKMGSNSNTDYKLRMLLSAVREIEPELTGVIDLSEGTSVHVSPD